jgi:hypothetical protein
LCIAYGNGLWVAGASGGSNSLATSTDGITWTGLGTTVFQTRAYGVSYGNGLWVAVGDNNIATSPDGIIWTKNSDYIFGFGKTVAIKK